jgi:hypothetical protein
VAEVRSSQTGELIAPDPVLGQALAHFPSDRRRTLIIAWTPIVVLALVLGLTTAQVSEWWGPVLTVFLMVVVSLPLGWYVLHVWNREIVLYEHGFSYREGSETVYFRYAEISSIRQRAERLAYFGGLLRRDVYRFTVTTQQGERFSVTNLYRRTGELGTRLTEQINRVLGPKIAQRLANGDLTPFGDTLAASNEGLRENGRVLSWAEYGGYRLGSSRLTLLDAAGEVWYALPLPEVDNVMLLLELLRQHQPAARK